MRGEGMGLNLYIQILQDVLCVQPHNQSSAEQHLTSFDINFDNFESPSFHIK
jgi:hypothetical protein